MTPVDHEYNPHATPEELLIFSILSRAILDLFGSVGQTDGQNGKATAKREALLFLTRKSGAWAEQRNELCDAVGIDGDEMRDRVVRVLEGDSTALATYERRRELTEVEQARKLWRRENGVVDRSPKLAFAAPKIRKPEIATPPAESRPRPQCAISRYADVRPIVLALLDRPHTFKDLIIATNGDVSDSKIRDVLRIAVQKGEVAKDGNAYALVSRPETAVAAALG